MIHRRVARRLALDVLYEAEIRDTLPIESFESRMKEGWVVPGKEKATDPASPEDVPTEEAMEYARVLVTGVQEHQADIDSTIVTYADKWALTRMPVVDRTLLRIALFELGWRDDIPIPVAINEAVELAKELSTDDSGRFINGLLGRVVEDQASPSF